MRDRKTLLTFVMFLLAGALSAPAEKAENGEVKVPAKKPASAPTDRIGNIRFTPPDEWEKSENKGIVVLNPKGVKPTECSVVLVSGEQLKGDFLQWFKKKWTAFAKGLTVIEGGERTTQDGPSGSEVLYESALLGKEKTPQAGVLLWSAHAGTGVEWILFQASTVEMFNKQKPEVVKLLAGIRLSPPPKPPAAKKPVAPAKPGKPGSVLSMGRNCAPNPLNYIAAGLAQRVLRKGRRISLAMLTLGTRHPNRTGG